MKYKAFITAVIIMLCFHSCNLHPAEQSKAGVKPKLLADKEIFCLYKKTNDTVYVARALETVNEHADLHLYELNIAAPQDLVQTFRSVQHLTKQELDNKKTELRNDYNWTPVKTNEVLFVQIQWHGFKDEMQLLYKSQEVERTTGKALENKRLGEWIAGDLGPGGGNMLYAVTDIDQSMQVILTILQENNLEKNVLIGRRIEADQDNWFYEVIYPTKYSGHFITY